MRKEIDQFDLEAEREARAIIAARKLTPRIAKRKTRATNRAERARQKIENRIFVAYMPKAKYPKQNICWSC